MRQTSISPPFPRAPAGPQCSFAVSELADPTGAAVSDGALDGQLVSTKRDETSVEPSVLVLVSQAKARRLGGQASGRSRGSGARTIEDPRRCFHAYRGAVRSMTESLPPKPFDS